VTAPSAELIDRARATTGLEDLGPDGWQVGLERLVEAVAADVVDPDAVDRIEAIIIERLVQRLRVAEWYSMHGAEATAGIVGPLVILGLPRTATTALHHLLAQDPQHRYLRSWELADPVPPPVAAEEAADPRRPTAPPDADVRHIVTVDGPAEDWPIHAMAFDHAELTLPVPGYSAWWRTRDHAGLFAYHEQLLRLLHSHRPPHRWLLKFPAYLFMLEEMATHYPDACFVMTHRDPVTVIASTCSVVADSRRKRVPSWQPDASFGRMILEHFADGMTKARAARAALDPARIVDVGLHELEADPVATAERVYTAAGLELTGTVADTMAAWGAANQRGSRGAHKYTLEEFGLTEAEVTAAFADYTTEYGC
jgi:hypothetical protein